MRSVADEERFRDGPGTLTFLRFMAEEGVDIPLWGDEGLIFDGPEELVRAWGVKAGLADEIVAWSRTSQRTGTSPHLDAKAARLIRLLVADLPFRLPIVYQP